MNDATTERDTMPDVTYDAHPDTYRHWKLGFDGPIATLALGHALLDDRLIRSARAQQAQARYSVLVFSRTTGFRHDSIPAANAACSIEPEMRVSRPTSTGPPSTRAAARPRATTSSGVRSALATPRTPSVPKRRVRARPLSAWSTAAPCGPSSGRTSCSPSRGRRG